MEGTQEGTKGTCKLWGWCGTATGMARPVRPRRRLPHVCAWRGAGSTRWASAAAHGPPSRARLRVSPIANAYLRQTMFERRSSTESSMSNRPTTKQQAIAVNRQRDPRKRRRLGATELAIRHGCLTEAAGENFRSRYDAGQIDSQGGAIALL